MNNPRKTLRRRALQTLAATGLSAAMAHRSSAETPAMAARPIPANGEMLPVVGLGTYQSFDVGGGASERDPLKDVLRLFVQQGGTLVDSSPMYGPSESVVGDLAVELGISARLNSIADPGRNFS